MSTVESQLQAARQQLLDLTMRNRLLNYKPTKARTIRVLHEIPREVYDFLVLNEKSMEFLPKPEKGLLSNSFDQEEIEGDVTNSLVDEEESPQLWELPAPDEDIANRHLDRFLQTPLLKQQLQKHLFYINQQARTVLEEQGYTVLYLALGFVEWTESQDSNITRKAPLILIPVELERLDVRSSFKLKWTGEDIISNISLQAKLNEQHTGLPDFDTPEDKAGIDNYYENVNKAIKNMDKWKLTTDIYLDFFSFTKFVMYKDLDPKAWPEGKSPTDHPLIQAILNPAMEDVNDAGFSENEIDEKLKSQNLYHVMDADPSQIAVIEDVKASKKFGC